MLFRPKDGGAGDPNPGEPHTTSPHGPVPGGVRVCWGRLQLSSLRILCRSGQSRGGAEAGSWSPRFPFSPSIGTGTPKTPFLASQCFRERAGWVEPTQERASAGDQHVSIFRSTWRSWSDANHGFELLPAFAATMVGAFRCGWDVDSLGP